ncbi:MAG: hypothetical protein ABEH59_06800 [Halobacteriales archaeon]
MSSVRSITISPNYRRALVGREVAIAFAVLAVLYYARFVRFQPLQLPAYLLIVGYDFVELALPILDPYHRLAFPVFLYMLAILGAGAARGLHARNKDGSPWMRTLGGVSLVIGVLSLLFGVVVGGPLVSSTDNPTPLAITGTAGVILLLVAWWSLGRPRP